MSGHHQWDFCAVVMEFVDATVPGVDVHFWRTLPQPMLRVYIDGVQHLEIDEDAALISDFKELLRRWFYHQCNRWRSVRRCPECDSLPRLSVMVYMLDGHLKTRFDILLQTTARQLFHLVCQQCVRQCPTRNGILDCIVLPPSKKRGAALNDRFPLNRVSMPGSSAVALDTLVGELGVAVHETSLHGESSNIMSKNT